MPGVLITLTNMFQSTRLREARLPRLIFCSDFAGFQSTRLREARLKRGVCAFINGRFQSTRLREARHLSPCISISIVGFNPRAYVRRDCVQNKFGLILSRFNPRAYVRRDGVRLID